MPDSTIDLGDSDFLLQKQRASRTLRKLFKTAEIVRAQVIAFPDTDTALILTPQLSYRYVRKPLGTPLQVGDYVSVLNPGGQNSGKNWEILNVGTTSSNSYPTNNTYQTFYTYNSYSTGGSGTSEMHPFLVMGG